MASKQSNRRNVAKIRSELYSGPWAIDARALGSLLGAVESGDIDAVEAALTIGNAPVEALKIVDGVAVIPVTGVLRDGVDTMVRLGGATAYQQLERDINAALENNAVTGILFYIDSPGGSAVGCKRIADLIFASRGEKPMRAYVQGMCGSAAYYIASATDRIEATADAMVGSVGTIFPHQEMSKFLDDIGVKVSVITNTDSPRKGHGNVYEPLSDEARSTLHAYVNSYGASFINDVARYRGVKSEDVVARYGQGDAMRGDIAVKQGVVDAVVANYRETLDSMIRSAGDKSLPASTPAAILAATTSRRSVMNERIKAQLYALGLIASLDASDDVCNAAMAGWFAARGQATPAGEPERLKALQQPLRSEETTSEPDEEDEEQEETEEKSSNSVSRKPAKNVHKAHKAEMNEARLADLRAARELVNGAAGYEAVTADMVLDAAAQSLSNGAAMKAWNEKIAANESAIPTNRVKVTEGADQYAADVVDALVYRAGNSSSADLSPGASALVNRPLWAVAGECLKLAGQDVDMYGSRETIAEQAMQMGNSHQRHTFFSSNEDRRYVQASGTPTARPGDFPNILSGLANKFLDTIQLDDDYSYSQISAVLPGGLNDFKPAMMMNKGIVEELDELSDAEQFKDLGLAEEVLSYIFLRRFGNKWGWTPVLVANDDMNAFAEGMLGLAEAWEVTQNRLVLDRFTANETLLDGSALFADRANVGTAANNNVRGSGNPPSDTEWGAMETLYADIGGINTGRRVRGSLNVALVPTGGVAQEARRTFLPLNAMGLEGKVANTTANVGLYRGEVQVIPESELRASSTQVWYGLRNPTRLNTATVVRAYFNGYGAAGRRERWYDPTNKTTYVSIEGRIATAVKNWRYAVRNAGTGAG